MANVHPYKGYLNTNFNLYANGSEDISYEIYSYENKIDGVIAIIMNYGGFQEENHYDGSLIEGITL